MANPTASRGANTIRQVAGEARTVRVPAVSEPWSATLSRREAQPTRQIPDFGNFPGTERWKREANERRKAAEQARGAQNSARLTNPSGKLHFDSDSKDGGLTADGRPGAGALGPARVSGFRDGENRNLASFLPLFSADTFDFSPHAFTAPNGQGVVFSGPSESDTHLIPPDPQIAAGPNYVVVAVNSLLAIYDKSGNLQGSYQSFSAFFSSLSITGEIFDPRIIYDQTDQRFIFSAAEIDFNNLTNGHVFLAVSATDDPTGTWNKFAINSEGRTTDNTQNTFPDFPGLGLSQSTVYVTTNQFSLTQGCLTGADTSDCYFSDAWVKVIGLPELLSGNSNLNITSFKNVQNANNFPAFAIQPALTYGSSNNYEFMVAARYDNYTEYALDLFAVPTSGTPTLVAGSVTVPAYQYPPDAEQGGPGELILTDDYRPLNAVWLNGSLFFGQNVYGAANVLARWYQVTLPDLASATLTQSGDVTGNGDAYYPAISVQSDGTIGLAFTTSSQLQFASAAFTEQLPSDPPGSTRSYAIYENGSGLYDEAEGTNRWGDYSGISVDPAGTSFWVFAEFAGTPDPHFGTAGAQITAPPAFSVAPSLLNFGAVLEGSASAPQTVTATNIGSSTVAIGTATLSGGNAVDFSISNDSCSGQSIPAGQTCTLAVSLKPSMQNTEEFALLSMPYGGFQVLTVGLEGAGIVHAVVTASPPSLNFPPTVVRSASAPQTVAFTNGGNTSTGTLSTYLNGAFTQTNNCSGALAPGASCQMTLVFHAVAVGTAYGLLQLNYGNSDGYPVNVQLTGIGATQPGALLCPSSLTFSNQAVNSTSPAQPVILTSSGSATLNIAKISIAGDFSESANCAGTVPAGSSCIINVAFTPSGSGARSGTLTVADDAPSSPQTISVSGTGTSSAANLLPIPPDIASALRLGSAVSPEREAGAAPIQPGARGVAIRRQPLVFEQNEGQFNSDVAFVSHSEGHTLAVSATGLVFTLLAPKAPWSAVAPATALVGQGKHPLMAKESGSPAAALQGGLRPQVVRLVLAGANPAASISGFQELRGKANYFIGDDPSRWRTNVPTYGQVKLSGVYPGIDLVYYGNQRRLEYDFVVAPHANPAAIRLKLEGQSGLRLDSKSGDLMVETVAGAVRIQKPFVYQQRASGVSGQIPVVDSRVRGNDQRTTHGGRRRLIEGHFVLSASNEVRFQLGHYDRSRPLVIDPVLAFSTYLGGSLGDGGNAIANDPAGNVYVAGFTDSPDFPITPGAYQTQCGPTCAPNDEGLTQGFVSKLNSDGSTLIYSTYFGGQGGHDEVTGIAVDSSGNAYLTGHASTSDFPVTSGAYETTCNILPGTVSACDMAFVSKLNSSGSGLVYSTYLGSETVPDRQVPGTQGLGIAIDGAGNAYVGGSTGSPAFPTTTGAYQTANFSDNVSFIPTHGFLTELNPSGTSLVYSTYLSGSNNDSINGVALDSSGNIYVAGTTASLDFPTTPGSIQPGGYGSSAFIAKFSPSGSLLYSTHLGGPGSATGNAIAVDSAGNAYVTGESFGGNFPTTFGAFDSSDTGLSTMSAFVSKIHPQGCALLFSTYLTGTIFGGSNGKAIAVDGSGDAFVVGNAGLDGFSIAFPLVNSLQPYLGAGQLFVSELDPQGASLLFSTNLGGSQYDVGNAIAVDSAGNAFVTGVAQSPDFPIVGGVQTSCPNCAQPTYLTSASPAFVAKISPGSPSGVFLTRTALQFASVPIGYVITPMQVAGLMNNQSAPLNISGVAISGGAFSLRSTTNPCSGSLAPGTGCVVPIQFAPNAIGPSNGTVTITDDGPGSPRTIILNGTGLPDFELALAGGTNPTQANKAQTVTYMVNIQGIPGVTAPSGAASLSCANISPAVCTFNPTSISIVGGNNQATLTVTNLSAVTGSTVNFTVVATLGTQTSPLPLSITLQDFSLTSSQSSATVKAGQSATYALTMSPFGGFNDSVYLSCTGAPALSACKVSPASVTLDGTDSATATVTVTTTAPSSSLPRHRRMLPPGLLQIRWPYFQLLTLMIMAAAMSSVRKEPRRAWTGVALVIMLVGLWVSCGGGGGGGSGGQPPSQPGTAPGVYTLTVTGTYNSGSATLTHGVNVTLNVQ